jgi:hypothetical protein
MNPITMMMIAQLEHEERVRRCSHVYLMRPAATSRVRRTLAKLGSLLISAGKRLTAQGDPTLDTGRTVRQQP